MYSYGNCAGMQTVWRRKEKSDKRISKSLIAKEVKKQKREQQGKRLRGQQA
jgi:hypothetical protein